MSGADIKYQELQAIDAEFSKTAGWEPDTGYVTILDPWRKWIEVKNISPGMNLPAEYKMRDFTTTAKVPGYLSPGDDTNKAGIKAKPDEITSVEWKGDLVFKQAEQKVTFKNIYVAADGIMEAFRDEITGDKAFKLTLCDERILWKDSVVMGDFNMVADVGGILIKDKKGNTGRFHSYSLNNGGLYSLFDIVKYAIGCLPSPNDKPYDIIYFPYALMSETPYNVEWKAGTPLIGALQDLLSKYTILPQLRGENKIGFYFPYQREDMTYAEFNPFAYQIETERIGIQLRPKPKAYAITSTAPAIKERVAGDWIPVLSWDGSAGNYKIGEYIPLGTALKEWGIDEKKVRKAVLLQMRNEKGDPFEAIVPKNEHQKIRIEILRGQAFKWFQMKDKDYLPMLPNRLDVKDMATKLPILIHATTFAPTKEKDVKKGLWKVIAATDPNDNKPDFDYGNGVIKFKFPVGFVAANPDKIENADKKAQAIAARKAYIEATSIVKEKIKESINEYVTKKEEIFDKIIAGLNRDLFGKQVARLHLREILCGYFAAVYTGTGADADEMLKKDLKQISAEDCIVQAMEGYAQSMIPGLEKKLAGLGQENEEMRTYITNEIIRARAIAGAKDSAGAAAEKDTSIVNIEACDLLDGIISVTYAYTTHKYFALHVGDSNYRRHFSVDWVLYDGLEMSNVQVLRDRALEFIKKDQQIPVAIRNTYYKFVGPVDVPLDGEWTQISIGLEGDVIKTQAYQNQFMRGLDNRISPMTRAFGIRGPAR